MNEDLRNRILEYNKKKQIQAQAYNDLLSLIAPLENLLGKLPNYLKKILPDEVESIIEKYRKGVVK